MIGLALALIGLATSASGCATRRTVQNLSQQVRRLEEENFQLRKDLTEARVRRQAKEEAERTASGHPASERPAVAPPSETAGSGEIVSLSAETPRVVFSEPITEVPREVGRSTAMKRSATPAPGSTPGNILTAGAAEPSRLMGAARELLDQKMPEKALLAFQQIVSGYPGDALADDAQFGVGEAYFQMGLYQEALAAYRLVIDQFPFGDQVPFAFLKVAFAHLALDQRDQAMDNFRTVSEAFPGTEAATVARQQIAHLKASDQR